MLSEAGLALTCRVSGLWVAVPGCSSTPHSLLVGRQLSDIPDAAVAKATGKLRHSVGKVIGPTGSESGGGG